MGSPFGEADGFLPEGNARFLVLRHCRECPDFNQVGAPW